MNFHVTIHVLIYLFLFQTVLKPLIDIALKISQLRELTGRQEPTVIT